jgi:hypothetical protein
MKRLAIAIGALTALSLPAWVPAVALSSPDLQTRIHSPPTPRVWLAGVYPTSTLPTEHWQQRHRFLLRKRFLATKRSLAEARAAAQLKAWQLYESTTTTTQPYVPPVTTTTQPYVYVAPVTTTTAAAASYGYGDPYVAPSSQPWPVGCILGVESGGTNNPGGDGGGYFQFEPTTWTNVTGLAAPATMYSWQTQLNAFWTLYDQQGGLYPAWQDGC